MGRTISTGLVVISPDRRNLDHTPSPVGDPHLNHAAGAALFAFDDPFVLRPMLDEQPVVGLDGVIKLQGEEILGIGELLDNERQDPWPECDQGVKLLADGSGVRVRTDRETAADQAFFQALKPTSNSARRSAGTAFRCSSRVFF